MLALEAAPCHVGQSLTHHLALLQNLRRTGRRAGRKRKVKDAECGEQRKGWRKRGIRLCRGRGRRGSVTSFVKWDHCFSCVFDAARRVSLRTFASSSLLGSVYKRSSIAVVNSKRSSASSLANVAW